MRVHILLALLAWGAAQAPAGAIVGTVRDPHGGVLPGVTVTAHSGGTRSQTVSDSAGRYRLAGLSPGTYRIESELAGFRRGVVDDVGVVSGKDAQRDLVMRIGFLAIVDYVLPAGGVSGALRQADVVVHFRITRVVGPRLVGESPQELMTGHVAAILGVVKADSTDLVPGNAVEIWQDGAGEVSRDGERLVGQYPPHLAGEEFVGLFRRDSAGRLRDLTGRHHKFAVTDGRVRWHLAPEPGIRDGMPVAEFLVVLRTLARR